MTPNPTLYTVADMLEMPASATESAAIRRLRRRRVRLERDTLKEAIDTLSDLPK